MLECNKASVGQWLKLAIEAPEILQDPDKVGRKVRPGFQTWTPKRGGRGDEAEGEDAGPAGPHALTAARAAAAAALRAQDRAAGVWLHDSLVIVVGLSVEHNPFWAASCCMQCHMSYIS